MPAKRKYSDSQRQAIFRLFEAGTPSREIAEACSEGRTGLAPFEIPARSVREVTTQMTAEADLRMPATIGDLEQADAMERFPARAARILAGECERLEAKQRKGPLSDKDLDRLARMTEQSVRVEKALKQGKRHRGNDNGGAQRSRGRREPAAESVIDRLAREEWEADSGANPSVVPTHARQAEPECGNKVPDVIHADQNPGQPTAAEGTAVPRDSEELKRLMGSMPRKEAERLLGRAPVSHAPALTAAQKRETLAAIRRSWVELDLLTPEAAAALDRSEAQLVATQATRSGG